MQITEVSVMGVRTAVVAFHHPRKPLRFLLFPMIHVGLPAFYDQVTQRLRSCQLIVAEGYDGPSSVGLAYLWALQTTRQRHARTLVHQNIDYEAIDVPVIWPERLFRERGHWRRLPIVGWLDVLILAPALAVSMAVGGRNWVLRANMEISDDTDVRMFPSFLQKLMMDNRDDQLLEALTAVHDTRADERIDVAVVYGAAHMPAVVNGLTDRLGYRPRRGGEWLTVIDF
jgi:hypothetical protein